MEEEVGIVMRSATRSRFPALFPGVVWEYFIIWNPYGRVRWLPYDEDKKTQTVYGAIEITRQEAKEYIRKHGLTLAYSTKDGDVYDSPKSQFKTRFKIHTKKQADTIERLWGQYLGL